MRVEFRSSSHYWSEHRIERQIRGIYRAEGIVEGYAAEFFGVVFHHDLRLVSRWQQWRARKEGGLAPFVFLGIYTSDYLATCVQMGDDPLPLLASSVCTDETVARTDASAWIAEETTNNVDYPSFGELSPFARSMICLCARGGGAIF